MAIQTFVLQDDQDQIDNPGPTVKISGARKVINTIIVTGGTVQIQFSLDGVWWVNFGGPITSVGTTVNTDTNPYPFARANVTAVSGTVAVRIGAEDL